MNVMLDYHVTSHRPLCIHTKRHSYIPCSQRERNISVQCKIEVPRDVRNSKVYLAYRYIDDVFSINKPVFENYLDNVYPAELEIEDTTESITSAFT